LLSWVPYAQLSTRYFSYSIHFRCGIPSITLLGEREDYIKILQRLDKLDEFGDEPVVFARLLRPVLKQFVTAFDMMKEGQPPDTDFWGKMCHYHAGGSGPDYIGGWLSAFCVWNRQGEWQGGDISRIDKPVPKSKKLRSDQGLFGPPPLVLDSLRYPSVDTGEIPTGFCEVDVLVDDNGEEFDCVMVAGHVGNAMSATDENGIMNTLRPQAEWFMFIKEEVKRPDH
jgi:hypothetical protein